MPCADKKLEASRKDFETGGVSDVDLVLTTNDLVELLSEPQTPPPPLSLNAQAHQESLAHFLPKLRWAPGVESRSETELRARSSGSIAQFVFTYAAQEQGFEMGGSRPAISVQRNQDFMTLSLERQGEERPLLHFAIVFGFRNVQPVLRQMRQGKCHYDFVEVMACPKGCINGAAQVSVEKG